MALLNEDERGELAQDVYDMWMYECRIYDASVVVDDLSGRQHVAIASTPRECKCSLTTRRTVLLTGSPPAPVPVETQYVRLPRDFEAPEPRSYIEVYDAYGGAFVNRFEVIGTPIHDNVSMRIAVRSVSNEVFDEYTV